jgi:hypothetical protein
LETDPPSQVIQQEDLDEYLNAQLPSLTYLGLPRCILKQDQSIQLGILLNGPSGKVKLKEGKLLNGEIVDIHDLERSSNFRKILIAIVFGLLLIVLLILSVLFNNSYLLALVLIAALAFMLGIASNPIQKFGVRIARKLMRNK